MEEDTRKEIEEEHETIGKQIEIRQQLMEAKIGLSFKL
ncbi:hypothetical protein CCACVL1_09232 [Corchorus capsularis]|uniref:Uncharacterized protein n=1 Tax=Corchorus capsularis TaxID=210143 RepID=A0A1R3IX60_COCAP|nr:hypothetical protein CCACVL1_09232 [Corchorus capsularis]